MHAQFQLPQALGKVVHSNGAGIVIGEAKDHPGPLSYPLGEA